MRKLIVLGVILEMALKRKMHSNNKSKKSFSSEEFFARAEDMAAHAVSRFAQLRKQYAKR